MCDQLLSVPLEWLAIAGLANFVPTSVSYNAIPNPEWPMEVVAVSNVLPPPRARIPPFDEERMLSILRGIAAGDALPTVEVHTPPGSTQYVLRDGFHRYHASIAVGYSHLPVSVMPFFDIHAL